MGSKKEEKKDCFEMSEHLTNYYQGLKLVKAFKTDEQFSGIDSKNGVNQHGLTVIFIRVLQNQNFN